MALFKKLFGKEKKENLDKGLEKTNAGFFDKLNKAMLGKTHVDEAVLDDVENVLVQSDVGVDTTIKIIDALEARVARDRYVSAADLDKLLKDEVAQLLNATEPSGTAGFELTASPYVVLVVGVNGVGKTTTIGKLAAQFKSEGKQVILGAADTFRAAAVDQLKLWG
ncbi:MAG: signal recognition particle receptor subunit alpha, partial [Catalinimonas sp.]